MNKKLILSFIVLSTFIAGSVGAGFWSYPRMLSQRTIATLESVSISDAHIAKRIERAVSHINKSLDEALWVDNVHLSPKHGKKVFHEEKKAVKEIKHLCNRKEMIFTDESCGTMMRNLAEASFILADTALKDALATNFDAKKIRKAEKELAKGKKEQAKGKYDKAIDHYRKAWEKVRYAPIPSWGPPIGI